MRKQDLPPPLPGDYTLILSSHKFKRNTRSSLRKHIVLDLNWRRRS